MEFTFSKQIITTGLFDALYSSKEQSKYKVFDHEKSLGEFFYNSREGLFFCEEKEIKLEIRKRFMLMPKVSVINRLSGEKIGKFNLPYLRTTDELIMGSVTYSFKKLKPDSKFLLFKLSTHGHYKFSLFNDTEEIIYNFKINYPRGISLGNITPTLPFDGSIHCMSNNLPALFAGFYLIEKALDQEGG
ncbi:hypothetical protein ACX0G9_23175 [Flavitalea flava]